ncbi:Ethanolamine utilization protein EutD [Sinobacterium norvegicum]|uniref:phosphate acetyltransferase n=1 Tax=Sinobacterium norvegicum TaxID=1641715 RepID=A0ABN8EHW2_9GAMM|nr:phosphate acetyltransferase [Sinobacterium norvegicum]CAH0990442.1 Ethanolamine utilization protein EutD [Sinobacterium norvegicum]
MTLIEQCKESCKKNPKRVVLPDANDIRVVEAASQLSSQGLAIPVLIGNPFVLRDIAIDGGISLTGIQIINPASSAKFDAYCEAYRVKNSKKNFSQQECINALLNPLFFASMMLDQGDADFCIAGNLSTTGDVIRAALRCVGLAEKANTVSSFFIMVSPDGSEVRAFSDAAVVPLPNEDQLADITIDTANNFQRLTGISPRVALLSFSTKGSAEHPMVQKVRDAFEQVKSREPGLLVDGELQFDAAVSPDVARKKAPDSPLMGDSNVLIFPSLNAGNIAYKVAQRLCGYDALGPMLQGLAKPVHDLSRGCSADDIIDITVLASRMA